MAIEICKRIILSLFFVATFLNAKGQHFEGIVVDVLNANTIVVLNDDKCIRCMECTHRCPVVALKREVIK